MNKHFMAAGALAIGLASASAAQAEILTSECISGDHSEVSFTLTHDTDAKTLTLRGTFEVPAHGYSYTLQQAPAQVDESTADLLLIARMPKEYASTFIDTLTVDETFTLPEGMEDVDAIRVHFIKDYAWGVNRFSCEIPRPE